MISFIKTTQLPETYYLGHKVEMTLENNKTQELFRGFMPLRKQILNKSSEYVLLLHEYNKQTTFENFTPQTIHTNWALQQVNALELSTSDFLHYTLPSQNYAIFLHSGGVAEFAGSMHYIFSDWFPNSGYEIVQVPHFEKILPVFPPQPETREEEIWIPIKSKIN